MTQEEKHLLLVDLYSRLLYGVKCHCDIWPNDVKTIATIYPNEKILIGVVEVDLDKIKPYLRPMSSMTDEEKKGLFEAIGKDMNLLEETLDKEPLFRCGDGSYYGNPIHYELDFLISHYFDHLGLIPRGLALSAKEGMYNLK